MGDQSLLDRASAAAAEHANVTVSINPATLEKLGHVDNTDLTRLPAMFAAARSAQALWAQQSFAERASHIKKMRDYIVANAEELASIVARDNGKSRVDALATEVLPCALACNWYMKNAAKVLKPKSLGVSSILFFNKRSQVMHVPMGVVGIISPWNYPLSIPFGELVMGLMAGNAIMLKVAAQTPLVGKAIEAIVAAGELPVGLFHHVVGSGGAVSTAFFKHRIDKLFFTGSVATGKQLMAQAAENLTPLSLELGGNDPMIVLADA
ncbi:MAG: aldehyde dehydrogenase family protein, partial [Burkholderiales bacterium]